MARAIPLNYPFRTTGLEVHRTAGVDIATFTGHFS